MRRDIIVGVSSTLITLAIVAIFTSLSSAAPQWFVNQFVVPNMPPATTVHNLDVKTLGSLLRNPAFCDSAAVEGMTTQCVSAMHRWCKRNGHGHAGFGQEFNNDTGVIVVACIK